MHDLGRGHRQEDDPVERARARGTGSGSGRARSSSRGSSRRPSTGRRSQRLVRTASPRPGQSNGCDPAVERELVPGVVELAVGLVEREHDHDRDRDQQVDDREGREDGQEPAVEAVPGRSRRHGLAAASAAGSVAACRPSAGQLLGAEGAGIDRHRDEDRGHQDERERRPDRVVVLDAAAGSG